MRAFKYFCFAVFLLIFVGRAYAEMQENAVSISPYIGGFIFDTDYNVNNRAVYGLRMGYNTTKATTIEALIEYVNTEHRASQKDASLIGYRLEGLYNFMPEEKFVPFLAVGLGGMNINYTADVKDVQKFVADYGAGVKYFITDDLALRGDVRHIMGFDDIKNNFEYTVGISYFFNQKEATKEATVVYDADNDGVPDNQDNCPGTPRGVKVDSKGCPIDSDGDGVADYQDKCPNTPKGVKVDAQGCPLASDKDGDGVTDDLDKCPDTPKGAKVDAQGCPLDSDGDGVTDDLDKCPDTPKGVKVDTQGCPLDSDGDGVADYLDKCPDTPKGVKVDAQGCPLDSDGDGVADYLDKCPDTPKGAKVDAQGCPIDSDGDGVFDGLDKCPDTPKGVKVDEKGCPLQQKVSTTMKLEFDSDKWDIRPIYNDEIKKIADLMKKYPWATVTIQGHTDSTASEAHNEPLAQNRANSVKQVLVNEFGIDESRIVTIGYGERIPIADNSTVEGRQRNRRIEAVVESQTMITDFAF